MSFGSRAFRLAGSLGLLAIVELISPVRARAQTPVFNCEGQPFSPSPFSLEVSRILEGFRTTKSAKGEVFVIDLFRYDITITYHDGKATDIKSDKPS